MANSFVGVLDVGVGVGIFLIGLGIFFVCRRLGALLDRVGCTLDEVDRQLGTLTAPVAQTLSHVGGSAHTADETIARLGGVVGKLESVAGVVSKTATTAADAIAPAIVNVGATLTGVTAGLRRLARGKNSGAGGCA